MKKLFTHKNKLKLLVFLIYFTIILILYLKGIIKADIRAIKDQLSNLEHLLLWYFIISTLRIILFIPQSVFIIVGGLIMDPWLAFILSITSHALSETIIYYFTKIYFDVDRIQKFILKNEKIIHLLREYRIKLLALGVSCPFVPSDLLASASAIVGINYLPYVTTVILAGTPLTFIYAFIGEQATTDSNINLILIILFIILFTFFSLRIYKTILRNK